jgi:hypothetical protein
VFWCCEGAQGSESAVRRRAQKIDRGGSRDWWGKSCLMLRRHSVMPNTIYIPFQIMREEMVKSRGSHNSPSSLSRIRTDLLRLPVIFVCSSLQRLSGPECEPRWDNGKKQDLFVLMLLVVFFCYVLQYFHLRYARVAIPHHDCQNHLTEQQTALSTCSPPYPVALS